MRKLILIILFAIILILISGGCTPCITSPTPTPTQPPSPTNVATVIPPVPTPQLKDPTWDELLSFLQSDDTDALPYVGGIFSILSDNYTPDQNFECLRFAETLQSNAKVAGWRCAIVTIHLIGKEEICPLGTNQIVELSLLYNTYHALNAFQTTDRGLIYIDDTGVEPKTQFLYWTNNFDKIVDTHIGEKYIPQALFPKVGQPPYLSSGNVSSINLQW